MESPRLSGCAASPRSRASRGQGNDASAAGRPLRGVRGTGARQFHRPWRAPRVRVMKTHRGFTLIELLVAIAVMALIAILSWRGLDGMVRAQEQTRARAEAHLVLQTTLAQWDADLDALQPLLHTTPIDWDGQVLRMTRRASLWPDPGALVVAWTRRNVGGTDLWLRWQSPPLRTLAQWQQAWQTASQWARNPGDAERRGEVALLPLAQWRLLFYRDGAWTNPQSSSGQDKASTASDPGAALPEGIRLEITLPPGAGVAGPLARDWVNPVVRDRQP